MSELPPFRPRRKITPEQRERNRASCRDYQRRRRANPAARAADRERSRRYRAANPNYLRDYHLQTKYGLTRAQWEEMFEAQGRCCDSCKDPNPPSWGRLGQWAVDHNHDTEKVRAILCHPCNTTLGQHKECPERLMKVALYAERHQ